MFLERSITGRTGNRLVEETLETFGRIDVLVNNAGVAPLVRADLLEMTEESYDRGYGDQCQGNMFLTQLIGNQMLKQEVIGRKRGTIVNVGSCSAEVSSISRGEYCISKSAIAMITKLFADRLAGEGILVHEVRPGVIMTDMTSTVKEKYDRLIAEGTFPIPRWGTPEDVAGAVSALCSDQFLYTTGNYYRYRWWFSYKKTVGEHENGCKRDSHRSGWFRCGRTECRGQAFSSMESGIWRS